jgi:uroporphyrinogen-III decarboxylase
MLKLGSGHILSSGHSINPAVTLANWLAMRDAYAKFGGYTHEQ